MTRPFLLAIAGVLALTGCYAPLTAANVNKIELCKSTFDDVKGEFGPPSRNGRVGDLTIHTYRSAMARPTRPDEGSLVVAYDANNIVVDLAFNAPGLVELTNHCIHSTTPTPPAVHEPAPAPE